jgi:hypothetical protein
VPDDTEFIDPTVLEPMLEKLQALKLEVEGLTVEAEKVKLPATGGGRPASALRKLRLALRAALDKLNP